MKQGSRPDLQHRACYLWASHQACTIIWGTGGKHQQAGGHTVQHSAVAWLLWYVATPLPCVHCAAAVWCMVSAFSQVDAPEGAAVPDASKVPRMHLQPAPSGTEAVHIRTALADLKAAAASDQAVAAQVEQHFGYDLLKVVASEELQAPGSGRYTKHVELELPQHLSYTPGELQTRVKPAKQQ